MNAGEEFMENNYRKDFRYAREVISNSSSSIFMNNDYDMDRPYWATTQNLNYIKDLCKNNDVKTAFTILGSADPIFELIGVGASDIVATDVNRFAKYIFYLKKAAFKTLSEKEYLEFIFNPNSVNFLSDKIYQRKVINGFSLAEVEYKKFWDKMFNYYTNRDLLYTFFKTAFSETKVNDRKNYLNYINDKKYNDVRDNIDKVNIQLYDCDALEVLKKSDKIYDFIDISNILIFVLQVQCGLNISLFKKYIHDLEIVVENRLKKDGVFIADYMFRTVSYKHYLNYNLDNMSNMFQWIYAVVEQTVAEYFDTKGIKYGAIPITNNSSHINNIGDQVVLAKIKK